MTSSVAMNIYYIVKIYCSLMGIFTAIFV